MKTTGLDIDSLAYGSTYVPAKVAIEMQEENKGVHVVWDMREDRIENTVFIKPQFPTYLYPIQKSHEYGATPPIIPLFTNKDKNTSMLWSLSGILSHVEEIWSIVAKIGLREGNCHGWLLTYVFHRCLTHHNSRAAI